MTFPETFVSPDATSQPPGVYCETLRICEDNFRLPDLVKKVDPPSDDLSRIAGHYVAALPEPAGNEKSCIPLPWDLELSLSHLA